MTPTIAWRSSQSFDKQSLGNDPFVRTIKLNKTICITHRMLEWLIDFDRDISLAECNMTLFASLNSIKLNMDTWRLHSICVQENTPFGRGQTWWDNCCWLFCFNYSRSGAFPPSISSNMACISIRSTMPDVYVNRGSLTRVHFEVMIAAKTNV